MHDSKSPSTRLEHRYIKPGQVLPCASMRVGGNGVSQRVAIDAITAMTTINLTMRLQTATMMTMQRVVCLRRPAWSAQFTTSQTFA